MASQGIKTAPFVSHSCRHSGSHRAFHQESKIGGINKSIVCFSGRGRFPATNLLLEQAEESFPPCQGLAHNSSPSPSFYNGTEGGPQEDGIEAAQPQPSGWLSHIQERLILGGISPTDRLRELACRPSGDGADGDATLRCDGSNGMRHEDGSSGDQNKDAHRECFCVMVGTDSNTGCGAATACSDDWQSMFPPLVVVTSRHRHFASAFACEAKSFGYMPVNASNSIFAVLPPDYPASCAGTGKNAQIAQSRTAWTLADSRVPNLHGICESAQEMSLRSTSSVLCQWRHQDSGMSDRLNRDRWIEHLHELQWKHMAGLRLVVRGHLLMHTVPSCT